MTTLHHIETSMACRASSLGAYRFIDSCCAPVMDPNGHEDSGEMYSPDDQGEYTSLDEAL